MFTPISEIKKLTIHELRDAIDELSHQIVHLERSQSELQEFLETTEGNEDRIEFQSAIDENKIVLVDKKKRVQVLRARLKLVDPAYYIEHYGESDEGLDVLGLEAETSTQVPVTISVEEVKSPVDNGLYL